MGHISIVYGKIIGTPWQTKDYHKLQNLNIEALNSLPTSDNFPWIHKNMFHSPNPENIEGTYREQVIMFGASYKAVEYDWSEWLDKFEKILKKLYWTQATIHLETELVGNYTYEWNIDYDELKKLRSESPKPVEKWKFNGGPRSFF